MFLLHLEVTNVSGLNTRYVPLTTLQEQYYDKLNDAPMAAGVLTFYSDEARTVPKAVYMLAGSPPDYTYVQVGGGAGNVITLSSIGTVDDSGGNNLVIYGYPYDADGNVQLYYMTVYNSAGQFQFSVGGFPNVSSSSPTPTSGEEKNLIKNGQFQLNYGTTAITTTDTNVAYGGWHYVRSSNTATDTVTFNREGSPIAGGLPSGNPRYTCTVACGSPGSDSLKTLEVRFEDVNRYSDTVQQLSLYFEAMSTGASTISVGLYKNFGTGGSAPVYSEFVTDAPLGTEWQAFNNSFDFGSNVGKTIGANDDDYFSIRISFDPALTFSVTLSSFVLLLGTEVITQYPFSLDPQQYAAPNYFATGGFHPLAVTTAAQAVTGAAVTVPSAGTYLISWTCSGGTKITAPSGQLYWIYGYISSSPPTPIPGTNILMADEYLVTGAIDVVYGSVAQTIVLEVETTTTFQVYISLSNLAGMSSGSVDSVCSASITAIRMGWN